MVFSVVGNFTLHNLWSRLIYLVFTEPFLLRAKRRVCSLIQELGKFRARVKFSNGTDCWVEPKDIIVRAEPSEGK